MIIPRLADAGGSSSVLGLATTLLSASDGDGADGKPTLQGWSTIIGIVTAIVGNIFISFALNIQRYAHIRISREFDVSKGEEADVTAVPSYGASTRDDLAANRAFSDQRSPARGRASYNSESTDADEHQPLLRRDTGREYDHSLASLSTSRLEKGSVESRPKTYLRSPYWWAGILLMTIGETGNFLAYGFAPASIVSPLGVVALVSNCLIAPLMLKEEFRTRDFGGVLVAIGGAVTVVLSAKPSNPKLGPDEIWDAITRWEFELYMGLTATLILVGMWASGRYGQKTILIDLGLVGLFGEILLSHSVMLGQMLTGRYGRRLYCTCNQGRCVAALLHAMAGAYLSHHLRSTCHPHLHRLASDTVRQSGVATLRFDAGHPHSIRVPHHLRHRWECHPLP
jgi:hypothetical protein